MQKMHSLIAHGMHLVPQDAEYFLLRAFEENNAAVFKCLIDKGTNLTLLNKKIKSLKLREGDAFNIAIKHSYSPEIIQLLLDSKLYDKNSLNAYFSSVLCLGHQKFSDIYVTKCTSFRTGNKHLDSINKIGIMVLAGNIGVQTDESIKKLNEQCALEQKVAKKSLDFYKKNCHGASLVHWQLKYLDYLQGVQNILKNCNTINSRVKNSLQSLALGALVRKEKSFSGALKVVIEEGIIPPCTRERLELLEECEKAKPGYEKEILATTYLVNYVVDE
ncbi:MAG: hypothetical protein WA432_02690 [Candidatus Babeliaceae bacterium]